MNTEAMKDSWDPIWDKIFSSQEWGKYPPEHVIRFVARNFYKVADRKTVNLVDIGSGTGACAWFMAREGFSVSSIEGSEVAVGQARQRFADEGLSGDLRQGDFVSLPWEDNYFDGAVENAALCCNTYENCKRVVAEVLRVLKPGAPFISANLSSDTWGFSTGEKCGHNEFSFLREGVLVNRGFALLMDQAQVEELYSAFTDVTMEKVIFTTGNLAHRTELWVVECRKSS